MRRWWLKRLSRAGVLRSNSDGTYWLDPEAWRIYRSVRRRRAVTVLVVILLSMVLIAVLKGGA